MVLHANHGVWGGSKRGLEDKRGQLFWDYIRILNAKNPLFFVAENVKGMLLSRYGDALDNFKNAFKSAGNMDMSYTSN